MERTTLSRKQILRVIRTGCVTFCFAACPDQAGAAPVYSPASPATIFTVNGSAVTVSGTSASAYFYDTSPNAYAVTIGAGSSLTNSSTVLPAAFPGDLIEFDHGSVNNSGTLTAKNDAILIQNSSGTTSGTVINTATGSISGYYGVYITGLGTVSNAGTITGTGTDGGNSSGVWIVGSGSVTNTGTINSETADGWSVRFVGAGSGSVVNSGTMDSVSGIDFDVDGTLTNSGSITATSGGAVTINGAGSVTNTAAGTIAGTLWGVAYNGLGTVVNSGTITGINSNGVELNGGGSVINSGAISSTNYPGIRINNTGTVTLAGGSVRGAGDAVLLNGTGAGAASTLTVLGRANLTGQLVSGGVLGTLDLNLVGLTPAKLAQLAALNGTNTGTFTVGGNTYGWNNLRLVDNSISLEQVVDPGLIAAATAVDNTNQGLPAAFDSFYVAASSNPEAAMNELVGREINQGIDTLGVNLNTTLASDLDEHLDNLLVGGQVGGIDVGGLHLNDAGSMYAYNDINAQLNSLMNMGGSVVGGTELSTDNKNMASVTPPQPEWGVWASGDVTFGDESGAGGLSRFHSTLGSPTFGLDYRVTPNLVLGVLFSYTTGNANFEDGSRIGLNTEIGGLYGTWRDGNWHVNGIAGGGPSQYHDTRTTFGGSASSRPDGDDIVTNWTGGYDFHLGDGWKITPEAGLQYTHLDVDSFTETGAGALDLSDGEQDINSLRSHVGFNLDKAVHVGSGVTIIPELRAQWYHEFMDDSRGVSTSLTGAPTLGSFNVNTFSPQRDFALVGVGLNTAFTGYKGVPVGLFINYDVQVGQSNYIAHSVSTGIRVDF
jgi:outer membrane autotransporter protein